MPEWAAGADRIPTRTWTAMGMKLEPLFVVLSCEPVAQPGSGVPQSANIRLFT